MMAETRHQRLAHANALIAAISRHGRRFFHDRASGRTGRPEDYDRATTRPEPSSAPPLDDDIPF